MIKNFLKNNIKSMILFVAVFILILISNVSYTEENLDNIWNFHMIQKVSLGFIPYKEINILITPLFHYVGSVFLQLFGNNFLAFYIYGAFISATIAVLVFKILRKITKQKEFITLGMSILVVVLQYLYFPNYNMLIFVFPLLLILLEWKRDKLLIEVCDIQKSKILDYIIGGILALGFLTKQTVGSVFGLIYVIYLIIYDKTKFKKINWKALLRKALGGILVITPFIIYLLATNSFVAFMDLCFGGIIDFGSKNSTGTFINWQVIFVISLFIFCYQWFKAKREDNKIILIGLLSLSSLIVAFPLANEYHINLPLILAVVALIYMLNVIFSNIESAKVKTWILRISYFAGLGFFLAVVNTGIGGLETFEPTCPPNGLETYYGFSMPEEKFNDILEVHEYIFDKEKEGYNVYIMSANASEYMIPLKRNNYKYDLILQGNLGYKGEEKLVEKIEQIENPLFLKRDELIFQESEIVDKYIKENYAVVDEIGEFIVYAEK